MTNSEAIEKFNIIYNNVSSNQAPGLIEEEIQYFLNRAALELVDDYFNPKGNKRLEGLDSTERRSMDFSKLIVTDVYITPFETDNYNSISDAERETYNLVPNSTPSSLRKQVKEADKTIYSIINEWVEIQRPIVGTNGKTPKVERINTDDKDNYIEPIYTGYTKISLPVIAVPYSTLTIAEGKPFARPSKRFAWKIQVNEDYDALLAGPDDYIIRHGIRFIRMPYEIDLTESTVMDDDFDEFIQEHIIQRAAELAAATYKADLPTQLLISQNSATQIGQINTPRGGNNDN